VPFFSTLKEKLKQAFQGLKNLPSKKQCLKLFSVLDKKEKTYFLAFSGLFLVSFVFLATDLYLKNTKVEPALGGKITEGVVGQPRFINPVLAPVNDVDRDLTALTFAGLMKYSDQGQIVPDLAQSYEVSSDGKTWHVLLKPGLVFQDNSPLTVDDVIFTVKAIQNPDYKSPLRPSWLGIEMEKISDLEIRFKLKNPYPAFLEDLTLKILPKRIWEQIPPENFHLTSFNLKPVGSGPYQIIKIVQEKSDRNQIKSITLAPNPHYYGEEAKIQQITFLFFDTNEDLLRAVASRQVQAFVAPLGEQGKTARLFQSHYFDLPRYFAVFFNQKNAPVLQDKQVRLALDYATDKQEIIQQVLGGQGKIVNSPLLDDIFGLANPKTVSEFDLKKAADLLEKQGFKKNNQGVYEKTTDKKLSFQFKSRLVLGSQGSEVIELQKCLAKDKDVYPEGETNGIFGAKTKQAVTRFQEKYSQDILVPAGLTQGTGEVGTSTRKKLNEICFGPTQETTQLKFSLVTVDDPVLAKTAQALKTQWEKLGAVIEITSLAFPELSSEFLRPRAYQALLFGQVLGRIPDPLPFWHSQQKNDPGLNLALYDSKTADQVLEEARQTFDNETRKQKLEKFQETLLADVPAIFLYQPDFTYTAKSNIKGIKTGFIADPSQRFAGITDWYIKTKRAWK